MKKYAFTLAAAFAGVLLLGACAAAAQEDITSIRAEAFTAHTRPAARFEHDAHNRKAGIEDCARCHHGRDESGRKDESDLSAGLPCAHCHAPDARQVTPLQRAYHQQCISCHVEKKMGVTHCAGCHQ